MKQIKYRQPVFFEKDDKFCSWHYWGWMSDGVFIGPMPLGQNVHGVMGLQNIAILDNQGNEIYEGDILRFDDKFEWYRSEYIGREREIDKQPYEIRKITSIAENEWILSSEIQEYWLIIGNIYENPELLKSD